MIALDPAQNAKLPRDMLLESCLQASFFLGGRTDVSKSRKNEA